VGELNRDEIDKWVGAEADKQAPTGVLGEIYSLLGKGLSLGEISNELRIKESKLRWLLKLGDTK